MLVQTVANIYRIDTDRIPSVPELSKAVSGLSGSDFIIEIHSAEGISFSTRKLLDNNIASSDIRVDLNKDCFFKAHEIIKKTGLVLVTAEDGSFVSCLKDIPTYYVHPYSGDGEYDLSFLNNYECIVLNDCNEYSVILLNALKNWQGKRIILSGDNWKPFLSVLDMPDKEIVSGEGEKRGRTLCVELFLPKNESVDRYINDNILNYDEVMTLTCLFCCKKHPGQKNRGKQFFVINGAWTIEGVFGIWSKAFTAARYVKKKGYIPVFHITWSDDSIYSDFKGDDIWGKLFNQPGPYTVSEVMESENVVFSPNMNILSILKYIMDEYSKDEELDWERGIFNPQVEEYIDERRERFLTNPEKTLGVLIRGTDYTKTRMAGHPVHADTEMVAKKIREAEKEWGEYEKIYLATEDKDIYEKMKNLFGERLTATDQERFSINEGELLYILHRGNRKAGEGFRLGSEYLCTIHLLSECESLIASGNCGGVDEAIRENENRYKNIYIFDLGNNPR